MNKLKSILTDLEISKWSAFWTLMTEGWAGLAKLICTALTRLLRKCDHEKLKVYAELSAKIALLAQGVVDIFVSGEKEKEAATATIKCIRTLAEHLEDGEYTTEELDIDVDNIVKCVDAWKKAAEDEEDDCPSCHE